MADAEYPGQARQTTTVTSSSTTVQTNIRFDPSYLRTIPGILKIVQVLSSILGFICVEASGYTYVSKISYYAWISMIAFWFSLILLGFYLIHIIEKTYKIPWLKIEFVYCAVMTLLFLIASCLVVGHDVAALSAAAFFGFVATAVYGVDAVVKFLAVRAGGLAQGSCVVSKQTTSAVTTPTPRVGY